MTDGPALAPKLYARADLVALEGIDDTVLPFWFREGLLIPEPAEARKHRRFSEGEAKIAALLGEARTLGLNINALRALAEQVRRGLHCYSELLGRFSGERTSEFYDAPVADGVPRELFWVGHSVADGAGGLGLSIGDDGEWQVRSMPNDEFVARAEVVFDVERILAPFGEKQ